MTTSGNNTLAADWKNISDQIGLSVDKRFYAENVRPVAGGCINNTYVISGNNQEYFIKTNAAHFQHMFEAEYEGLIEIRSTNSVSAPEPLCYGTEGGEAYLAMQYLELARGSGGAVQLGTDLAHMHRTSRRQFGWHRDNTIGSTPQINTECDNWVNFWRDQRLSYQLQLAADMGFGGRLQQRGEQLLDKVAALICHSPAASLLHGDLWSGNFSMTSAGQAVIFDPAVYYGDREADMAMTELFGGFSAEFYAAYNDTFPLDKGYSTRKTLYNLYHILNHLNLFGSSYLRQAQAMIDHLLSEVK